MAPVQIRGTVLTLRRVDAYHALTLVAPAIATKFRPGQFITIAVGGPETSLLGRRAFAVHDVRPDHGGTVEFVFEARGPGTRWLAERRAREVLDTVGPLGRPFPIPKDPLSCLLLGVGYGSAPLFAYVRSLDSYSTCETAMVTVLLASRTMPPLAISAYDLTLSPVLFLNACRCRMAAVRVVLPWSMWPIVPMLT